MSARIFVHPRCHEGPALGAFTATLEVSGYDCAKLFIGPEDKRKRRELVRAIEVLPNYDAVFERMDGSRYTYRPGSNAPAPEPEAA